MIRDWLGDRMRSLALRAHAKGLELLWHVNSDVPECVFIDAARIQQCLANFVGNAVKFTESGEVVVRVSSVAADNGRTLLEFAISDTGIGIAESDQTRIFEAFTQADMSPSRKFGGTGLGLPIASSLIEQMGGSVTLKSQVGEGTTFRFTIVCEVADPTSVSVAESLDTSVLSDLLVAVVDDNQTNLDILGETLHEWGLRVLSATNAEDAKSMIWRQSADATPVQLLITDMNMPGMDGLELIRELRGVSATRAVPVILLTSGHRPEQESELLELGVAAILLKPTKQSELLQTIAQTLIAQGEEITDDQESEVSESSHALGPLKILLAEDGEANRKLALGVLSKWGHETTVAVNGLEAVEASGSRDFDLILMDVRMPEMDGLEATRRIRLREERDEDSRKHVPIIAMTAHAMRGDREMCLESGMDGYLTKPIHFPDLKQSFDQFAEAILDQRRLRMPAVSNSLDIDWTLVVNSLEGDRELLCAVLSAALEECPRFIEALKQGVESCEAQTVRNNAHAIKGSLRLLQVARLDDAFFDMESMGAQNQLEGAPDALVNCLELWDLVRSELERFVRQNSG